MDENKIPIQPQAAAGTQAGQTGQPGQQQFEWRIVHVHYGSLQLRWQLIAIWSDDHRA